MKVEETLKQHCEVLMSQRALVDLLHSEHPHTGEITQRHDWDRGLSERQLGLYTALGCLTGFTSQRARTGEASPFLQQPTFSLGFTDLDKGSLLFMYRDSTE